jgi:hypothetical protein
MQPIGAVQVGNPPGSVDAAQLGMLAGNLRGRKSDVVESKSPDAQTLTT